MAAADADPAVLTVRADAAGGAAAALAELSWAGIEVAEFALGQPTLDEVFLALTGSHAATPKEIADDHDGLVQVSVRCSRARPARPSP